MRIDIHCITGHVEIENMADADVAAMLDEYRDVDTQVMTVTLDDDAVTHILRRNITRIDIDYPEQAKAAGDGGSGFSSWQS